MMGPQASRSTPGTDGERGISSRWLLVLCSFITACVLFWLATQPEGTVDQSLAGAGDASLAIRSTLVDQVILLHGGHQTAHEVLKTVVPSAAAFLVVTPGPTKPSRRGESQPFLTTSDDVMLPTTAINIAAVTLEQAIGRRLFALRIESIDMRRHLGIISGSVRPYAVWEVGTGLVLVDKALVQTWADRKMHHMIGSLTSQLFTTLADSLQNTMTQAQETITASSNSLNTRIAALLGPALSLAVASAFATAPPLWFCIMCPAVLGLLAPLLINIALNQLAGYLCVHLSLPDDQCFDLLIGALGLGFVLSLASAIPIFVVCRLQDCSHREGGGITRGGLWGQATMLMGRKWWGGAQGASQ